MQNKIYVGNLSYSVTEDNLRELFSNSGQITDVVIPKDRETGKVRGFAFVTFETQAQAQQAVNTLNGQEFQGRTLKINIARERESGGGSGSGRSSGGGGRGGYKSSSNW